MSVLGVPVDEVTAKDFIMVRAALVKRLGGANEALVWSRIEYRSSSTQHAHEHDGRHWWKASYDEIAAEVGLSRDQVKRVVARLVERGFLVAEKHHGSVQTVSYSPVIIHRADSPSGSVPSGDLATAIGRIRPGTGADSPSAPLYRDIEDLRDTPVVPSGTTTSIEAAFDQVWGLWPVKRRVTRKKSWSSFQTAVRAHGGQSMVQQLVETVAAHASVWSTWPESDQKFVPMLPTWLNQERWTMPLPEPRGSRSTVDHGREVDAILRARMAERERAAVGS